MVNVLLMVFNLENQYKIIGLDSIPLFLSFFVCACLNIKICPNVMKNLDWSRAAGSQLLSS